ncbi:Transposon TX1 uncharacterized 149 kDa protein [Vitis vinifera]|uniref:Transposon TX1 uncharacterized 149 kDa protein n=1 Tax=Vitis vinifera TaxID=29760 RepID=A0A438IH50_VITVI|nr:Transposon TX1 uncharacterized 149 kDa protein [Vitis vinifera]
MVERKTVKVLIERKTFLIRLEGEQGSECLSIEESYGFQQKIQGKMQGSSVGSCLQQPWKSWESIKKALATMLVVPYPNAVEKGRNIRGESWPHNKVDSMHRSYAKIVSDEGPRGGGLVPVGGGRKLWARLKIVMKDRAILLAMLEVTDGDWVFTVVVVVVGDEERRRGSEKGESTRVAVASHTGTDGMDGIGKAGGDWAGEDEAIANVGCRARERKAQSLAKTDPSVAVMGCKIKGPLGLGLSPEEVTPVVIVASSRKEEEDSSSAIEKGKSSPGLLEFQSSRLAEKKLLYGSRKLWSTFFPPSSEHRQGIRCSSEPILRGKIKVDSEEDPKTNDLGAESQANRGLNASPLFSPCFPRLRKKSLRERDSSPRKEADLNIFFIQRRYESGFTKSLLNPPVHILSPSSPMFPDSSSQSLAPMENRVNSEFFFKKVNDEGQIPVDIPNLEMETEVIQPACPYQMSESVNSLSANLRSPFKESSKATVNLGGIAGSPSGEFQIEGLSPRKMAKVREVLKTLDIKGHRVSHEDNQLEYQGKQKKEECDRRFVGSVWTARNKDWAALLACGASGGILIIWDAKKLCREEVVLGSVSVSIKFALDGCESLWLSAVYGPNNSALRKDFWVELSDIVGLAYPRWCVGDDFNVIRRSSEKLGGSRLTPSMKDFDDFIRDCELIDLPLRSASFTWSNMQENPVCKRLDRFLYSNEWEQAYPQSIQGVLPRWTSDHWPIVLETNPFKWGPTPFRFENMWLQHPSFKESFGRWWREFQGNGWEGHKFMRKLQFVKAKLKEWNKASFGELSKRKKDILSDLVNFDSLEQEGGLSHELLAQRALRKGELEELILREEIHWRQKARVKWESIKEEILRYFEKLYTSPSGDPWRVEGLDWSPISGESAFRLESPFTEEEIFKVIFQMDRDKAPGPDGFTIAVFQDCWEVIKEDLVKVFAEFHRSGIINQSTNASFIVLLPKKNMSRRISDFRPISLITSLYKIIAKVLAGRIRGVLHETIHSTQGAFVQGRQILDAVLIANEIVDEKRRSGEEGVVFKIDFEKAYDHVILVNGNAKGWVKASRGLRQGDPLSPFLFTIVADVLNDTIFFSSSREEDMMTLKNVLLVFGHISGLKVNLDKSNIYGINLEQNHLSRLAEMLDCKASGWPILYLGLPLGGNPKASGFWDPVIERISRRLDGWQKAYLSFECKITLIQSCLTHMPCYFLSLFKIPASVAAKIERMQRDFLWSGVGEGKRDHLVNWDVVWKWLWRYPREGSALWHQVILSIYGSHSNGWDVNNIVRWSHRCPWKAIALVYQEFSKFTRFVVGNGDRIWFWDDLCWGEQPLGVQYPRLLSVVTDKNAPISSILGYTRPFSWNFNFRRNLSNSEIKDLEGLMRSFDRLHISPSFPDKRSWSLSPSGLFTIKSFFLALSQYSESPPVFPTKFVWNAQVPFKVKSFVWLVAHKKVNTNDLLQLRRPYKALSLDILVCNFNRYRILKALKELPQEKIHLATKFGHAGFDPACGLIVKYYPHI